MAFPRIAADITMGFPGDYLATGSFNFNTNAAANWIAYGFVAQGGKTLSEASFYVSAVTGSPIAANFSVELQADSGGAPSGTSLETKAAGSAPSAGAWTRVTGFTTALTDGNHYYLVVKNLNGTPASNYFTTQFPGTSGGTPSPHDRGFGKSQTWGWNVRESVNSGSTWASSFSAASNVRLKFSDVTYAGFPIQDVGVENTSIVYGTREYGAWFTYPSGYPTANVIGIAFEMSSSGTPAGNLRYRLYTGSSPSLLATTYTMAYANMANEDWIPLFFSAAQAISANTILRVTIGTSTGGDSSNFYRSYAWTIDNDANSKALTPWGGTKATYFNASTWAEDDTRMPGFSLILDPTAPFTLSGGGGGLLRHPGTNGGLNG